MATPLGPDHIDPMNTRNYRFFELDTIPVESEQPNKTPSLVALAHDAEVARLQNVSLEVESNGKAELEAARPKKYSTLDEIVHKTRVQVQASEEAAEEHRLEADKSALDIMLCNQERR
jgi:hypothetical protein